MNKEIDVRHVLPAVRVPTLILHGSEDTIVPVDVARYMSSRIPMARLVEIPGAGHLLHRESAAAIAAEVERFLKDVWDAGGWEEGEPDRVLATVLFTDIVASTAKATQLGDRAWRELLERHHALIRRQLVRFRGAELDVAGDGFFARFDGPARAIRCACAITESVRELGVEVRAGLHTGECEVMGGKVGGIAVSERASQRRRSRTRFSSRARSRISSPGLGSNSRTEASPSSKAFRANGVCTQSQQRLQPLHQCLIERTGSRPYLDGRRRHALVTFRSTGPCRCALGLGADARASSVGPGLKGRADAAYLDEARTPSSARPSARAQGRAP